MGLSSCHGLQHMKRRERNGWMPFCVSGGLGMGSGVERERGRRPLAFGSLHGRTATNITSIRRAAAPCARPSYSSSSHSQQGRNRGHGGHLSRCRCARYRARATPLFFFRHGNAMDEEGRWEGGPSPRLLLSSAEVSSSSLSLILSDFFFTFTPSSFPSL